MSAPPELGTALGLALRQLTAIRGEDFDAYAAGLDQYEAACASATALDAATFDDAGRAALHRLQAIHSEIVQHLGRQLDETRGQLGGNRRSRKVNRAYVQASASRSIRTTSA